METPPSSSDDGGLSPSLRNVLILVLVPGLISAFGGCLQYRSNQMKHEQILGELEKVRQEVRERNTRP